jgi:hypothetical protein
MGDNDEETINSNGSSAVRAAKYDRNGSYQRL